MPVLGALQQREILDEEKRAKSRSISNYRRLVLEFEEGKIPKTGKDELKDFFIQQAIDAFTLTLNDFASQITGYGGARSVVFVVEKFLELLANYNRLVQRIKEVGLKFQDYKDSILPNLEGIIATLEKVQSIVQLLDAKEESDDLLPEAGEKALDDMGFLIGRMTEGLRRGLTNFLTFPLKVLREVKGLAETEGKSLKVPEAAAAPAAAAAAAADEDDADLEDLELFLSRQRPGAAAAAAAADDDELTELEDIDVGSGKGRHYGSGRTDRFTPLRLFDHRGNDIYSMRRQEV